MYYEIFALSALLLTLYFCMCRLASTKVHTRFDFLMKEMNLCKI